MVTVTPTNLQKMEFDVTTAEGPSRVTVVTGVIPGGLEVSAGNNFSTQSINLTALLDPTLTPGQFRKATATAALATGAGCEGAHVGKRVPRPVVSGRTTAARGK